MKTIYKSIILAITLLFALSTSSPAAPGDLDPTFGNGGIAVTSITNAPYYDVPRAIQVQRDGKIVVCGDIRDDDSDQNSFTVSFFLARYNPNGTLDTSFGTNGKIVAPINAGQELVGYDIALQPDGKVVAVGEYSGAGGGFAVNRYNSDGTLDASFGTGGKVLTQGGFGSAQSVTVQPDSKIVVAGIGSSPTFNGQYVVVRYNPNGSLDTSFGEGGKVITPFDPSAAALVVMLQSDGKIVVAGSNSANVNSHVGIALARYNADGSLDSGFGSSGKVVLTLPNADAYLTDAVLQPDGRIVVIGYLSSPNPPASAVVRFNTNGSVDTTFAANGIFTSPNSSTTYFGTGIAIQPDGKIVSFGNIPFAVSAVQRLNPNGSPDTGFGPGGVATMNLGNSYGLAGAVQPNGGILFLGYTWIGGDVVTARFLGDPTACPNPIDCNEFFIRQHYRDFLGREPDPDGLAGWMNILNNCGITVAQPCDRIEVSSAFFRSPEFQGRGYFIYRFYPTIAKVPIRSEFMPDFGRVSGFLTDAELETAKATFVTDFMARSEFQNRYASTFNNPAAYVDALLDTVGLPNHPLRQTWINSLSGNNSPATRAQVLRSLVESTEVYQKYYHEAFVLMQYFGYLRRTADAAYLNWIQTMNQNGGDYRVMINGFLNSSEYRQRFGP